MSSLRFIGLILGAVFFAPTLALAQTQTATPPPHVPLQKAIGEAKPEVIPSLIVLNSRGATLQGQKLTLTGVSPNAIVFADRPVRAAGHDLTTHLLEEWSPGAAGENFAEEPPNATVSAFSKDGSVIRDAVVVLKTPKLDGDRLTFDVEVLEGDLTGADGAAAIFIDRFGFAAGGFRGGGFARGGVVGVGHVGGYRGVGYHGAWYRGGAAVGAAAVGGAALGAAAAGAYGGYGACGYYPYPPCY